MVKYISLICLILLCCTSVLQAATVEGAVTAYEAGNFLTARRLFKEAANSGNSTAQRYLAIMYDKGQGGAQDYLKAVEWYKKAAVQNDSQAQYMLGVKYVNGHGVGVDEKLAYAWFAIAFNNGYQKAANPLKVLNQTLPLTVRQEALRLATQKLTEIP